MRIALIIPIPLFRCLMPKLSFQILMGIVILTELHVFYVIELRRCLRNLSQNRSQSCRIRSNDISNLGKLRIVKKSSQVSNSKLLSFYSNGLGCQLLSLTLKLSCDIGRDSVEQVLNCPFNVIESRPQSLNALLSWKSHGQ
jgi:hypothetical protein